MKQRTELYIQLLGSQHPQSNLWSESSCGEASQSHLHLPDGQNSLWEMPQRCERWHFHHILHAGYLQHVFGGKDELKLVGQGCLHIFDGGPNYTQQVCMRAIQIPQKMK